MNTIPSLEDTEVKKWRAVSKQLADALEGILEKKPDILNLDAFEALAAYAMLDDPNPEPL